MSVSCSGSGSSTASERAANEPAATASLESTTEGPTDSLATVDVLYNEDPDRQIVDVHLPAGDGPHPTILAIHGGAWTSRSKSLYDHYADYFTERGIALVSTNYRFVTTATWPAQVEDVQCALAWLHANAQGYGLDPERVIVLGGSAGGYLAAMLGTVDDHDLFTADCPHVLPKDPVAGAVVLYGTFDFRTLDDQPSSAITNFERLWGTTHDQLSTAQLEQMSPIAWIDGSEPPFLLIHGVADTLSPSVMSERFHAALAAAGAPTELILIERASHAFELQPTDSRANVTSLTAIERFINELG